MTDLIQLQGFNVYFALAISGLFSGIGSAISTYFVNKHIIDRIEKLSKKIKGKKYEK